MIASSRIDLVQSEALFADGFMQWAQGEDGPNAVAAARIFAETFLWWRMILKSKITQ